jgi:hypothetical protein
MTKALQQLEAYGHAVSDPEAPARASVPERFRRFEAE